MVATRQLKTSGGKQLAGRPPVAASPSLNGSAKIRLLILEESARAELVIGALHNSGVSFTSKLVETKETFARELNDFAPDLVLVGSVLPTYSGRLALEFARRTHPDIPVIMISGWVAAEASERAGANGYIFNDEPTRLGPAVLDALHSARERRTRGRTEELLRMAEVRYRRLFEAAKDGILILDANAGQILDANPFMTELLGYSHDEYLGKYLWEIGAFVDLVANQEAFKQLQQNRYIRYDNLPLRTKDGRMVDVEFVSNVYPEDQHDTIQCNIRDITERKAAEKKLFEVQKMAAVGLLTGGIAHDFNNLLTVIIGSLDIAPDQLPAKLQSAIAQALQAAERGAALTHRLLAFSRKQTLNAEKLDINRLAIGMEGLLRRTLGEHAEVEMKLAAQLWPSLADKGQVENALLNLAINARDAMPTGGKLTIETRNMHLDDNYAAQNTDVTAGDYVMLAVTDTGVGMAPDIVARAFEPFFTTKGIGKGTGLGLSMIYGFGKQSRGHVKIHSEIGHGTTVCLYLPRLSAGTALAETAGLVPSTHPHGGETILVVEDDVQVRALVLGLLRELGYHVLEAVDGPQAQAILENDPAIDLLFTDLVMPGGITGRQLAESAKRSRPALKTLFTSGYTDDSLQRLARLDPGVRLLAKPYRRHDLAIRVREALDA